MPQGPLASEIRSCRACPLSSTRTRAVPGEGPWPAAIAIIGEGPGAQEDATGRPFVGPAGKLLEELFAEAGLSRRALWIGNVVKCRAHAGGRDRPPSPDEVRSCLPWLVAQMAEVRPLAVLLAGAVATRALLPGVDPARARGRVWPGKRAWAVPTYHPAYLLRTRDPRLRAEAAEHIQLLTRAVRVNEGTMRWPWRPEALEAIAAPGQKPPQAEATPPWARGRGNGEVWIHVAGIDPAFRTPALVRTLLDRACRAMHRRPAVSISWYDTSGRPVPPGEACWARALPEQNHHAHASSERCWACGSTSRWQRPDEGWVCATCHPPVRASRP